jgi:DNA-directed RNA polymerase specialized sigma24 family protein
MEQISDNIPSVSHTLPQPYKDDLKMATEKIKKYEPLLHTIANSFGFTNSEASAIIQDVCLQAYKYYTIQDIRFPLKVWLVKDLIHKCTFKISQAIFSQQQREPAPIRWMCLNFHSAPGALRLQEMPLSLKAVYILTDQFYFNEIEVAEILNISTLKVKERLHKALNFLNNHT